MLFDDAAAQFAAYQLTARGRSRATVDSYATDLEQFAQLTGVGRLADLNRDAVIRWLGRLAEAELAPRSRARKLSALRSFIGWAREYNLLSADPLPREIGTPRSLYLPHALSEEEVGAILAATELSPARSTPLTAATLLRDRAIIEVLYASGMRVSELTGLTLLDLHLGEGFAMVTGKGSKQRLVPLGQWAIDALTTYMGTARGTLCRRSGSCVEVFLSQRGPISRSQVFRIIKHYAALAGVKGKVSPHTFRHSCASHLLARGADLRLVQELLGHAALTTTQVYTHIEKSRLRKVYDECHPLA
jgi:integrase/recombinase XerD